MSTDWFLPEERYEEQTVTNMEVMVDIETLGTTPGAPVLTIGATLFDPHKQDTVDTLMARSMLARVNIRDAMKYSDGADPDTLKWWFSQDKEAQDALFGDDAMSMENALKRFRQFIKDRIFSLDDVFFDGFSRLPQACKIWANAPNFDCTILEDKYRRVFDLDVEQKFPLLFFTWRDCRTIKDLAWQDPEEVPVFDVGVKHDARADSVSQALMVQAAYLALGLSEAKFDTF